MATGWTPAASSSILEEWTRTFSRGQQCSQISYLSDTQIWRYSCLNFSHIWLDMPIQVPKIGVLGDFGPLTVIIHHRDPQKAHPCVNPRLLINCKNPLRVLTCRRVDRKCDRHTHIYVPTIHCGESALWGKSVRPSWSLWGTYTDTHTHTHTQVNLYSVHAQRWTDK